MNDEANEQKTESANKEANPDPITGEHGAHPVGTGVGAAGGGLTGAAIGAAIGGPVGAAVGAVVGGVVGAYSGRGVAEAINPTHEDAYWREHHEKQPWADKEYEHYAPAYRTGYQAATRYAGRHYDEIEADVARDYEKNDANPALPWDRARPAVRAAWHRVSGLTGARESDRGIRGGP
jgi:phage tail tape-measure protein